MPFSRPNLKIVLFTGQVGVGKTPFIHKVAGELKAATGKPVTVVTLGDRMYAEDPRIPPGEILKYPQPYLRALRRAALYRMMLDAPEEGWLFINTHASFSWAHGLFDALDDDIIAELKPTMFINVIDNHHMVWARLRGNASLEHTMGDVLTARVSEMNFSMLYAKLVGKGAIDHFVVARGPNDRRAAAVARLITNPKQTKVYPSFPMTHVADMPEMLARIDRFRDRLAEHFVVFDPADVDEKGIYFNARKARSNRQRFVTANVDGAEVRFSVADIIGVDREVDRQICDRDFKLIDQSDMIVSLVPDLPDGKPSISSGVERELQHAFETGKKVFVVWLPKREPSPFISNHATKVFRSEDELFAYFVAEGVLPKATRTRRSASMTTKSRRGHSKKRTPKPSKGAKRVSKGYTSGRKQNKKNKKIRSRKA